MSGPENPLLFDRRLLISKNGEIQPIAVQSQVSLRDLFAAFALAGMVMRRCRPDAGDSYPYSYDAQDAYEAADAMLAEREKKA